MKRHSLRVHTKTKISNVKQKKLLEPKATANTFFLILPSSVPLSYCKNPQKRKYHQNVKKGMFIYNFYSTLFAGSPVVGWFDSISPNLTKLGSTPA